MRIRIAFAVSLAVATTFAFGQATTKSVPLKVEAPSASQASDMSSASESLLLEPKVLVALKISQVQLAKGYFRMMFEPIRALLKAKIKSPDDDLGDLMSNLNWMSSVSGVRVADLTSAQRQRLYEIALQENLYTALLTPEIGLSLRITASQRKMLEAINSNYETSCAKAMKALAQDKEVKALSAKMEKVSMESNDVVTPEAIDKAFDRFYDLVPMLLTKFAGISKPLSKIADKDAMHVLTPSQRRMLKRMQGKAI